MLHADFLMIQVPVFAISWEAVWCTEYHGTKSSTAVLAVQYCAKVNLGLRVTDHVTDFAARY